MSETSTRPSLDDGQSFGLMRRLLAEHAWAHLPSYVAAFLLMAVSAGATTFSVWLLRPVVNGMTGFSVTEPGAFKHLRFLALTVAALYIVRGLATFGQLVLMSRTGNRIVAALQERVYDHLLHQPVAFFSDRHSSELMSRLALAANSVRDIVQLIVTSVGRDALTVLGLLIVMIYDDPLMSVIALSGLPLGALVMGRLMGRVRRFARRSFDGSARIMQHMGETVQGVRIIKSFNLEGLDANPDEGGGPRGREGGQPHGARDRDVEPCQRNARRRFGGPDPALRIMADHRGAQRPRFLLRLHRVAAGGLRARQAPGALQPRPAKRPRRRPAGLRASGRALAGRARRVEAVARRRPPAHHLRRCALQLSSGGARAGRDRSRGRARQDDRPRGSLGGREIDHHQPAAKVLRTRGGTHLHRRSGHLGGKHEIPARRDRLRGAGRFSVPRHDPRQHRARQGGRDRGRHRPGGQKAPTRTISSWASRKATRRASGSRAPNSRADNASASPSRVPSSSTPRSSCSTSRPRHSIRNRSGRSRRRWRICGSGGPRSSWPTGCRPSWTPTGSAWWRTAGRSSSAPTTDLMARHGSYHGFFATQFGDRQRRIA